MDRQREPLGPVLVIGMHRSGTSMIARVLSHLGVFMGADLENNHESRFFINCNSWLLRQCGGSWSVPVPMKWMLSDAQVARTCEEYLKYRLRHLPAHGYLGWRRFLHGERPIPGLPGPWGWKDPRNTFTLPFWASLFPNFRAIHIYRNGVAVAASLREKTRRRFAHTLRRHHLRLRRGSYRWFAKRAGFGGAVRCLDLMEGVSLWESYMDEAFGSMERFERAAFLTVRYEDFLNDPSAGVRDLVSFCGLRVDEGKLAAAITDVDRTKGDRFMADPELLAFYQQTRDSYWMKRLGYGNRTGSM